jgi:ribosomal-protein-alanine N-acetyltransferase
MNKLDNFQTKRMAAERLGPEHFEFVFQMHQDKEIMAYLGGKRSRRQTRGYMAFALDHWQKYGYGIWILREIGTGLFVGRGGLRNAVLNGKDEVEVAYGFIPQFWNKGLATELVETLVRIGLTDLKLSGLVCVTHPDNTASQRVMTKTGFQYESELIYKHKPHLLYRYQHRIPQTNIR